MPSLDVVLDLYGVPQGEEGDVFFRSLEQMAAGDPRISLCPPVPNEEVPRLLRRYHVLAVPSRVQDVSPFVVLESLAAGTPVLGSNTGGIPEWVVDGANGLLIESESISGWADALRRLASDRSIIEKMRAQISPPRGVGEAAEEVMATYRRVLAAAASARIPTSSDT
jgi:glycosyltransferase involved in cell wall biosynthesis